MILVVGLGGLEPPASPLSGVRSNHLSYRPGNIGQQQNLAHDVTVVAEFIEESSQGWLVLLSRQGCRVKQTSREIKQVSCVDVLRGKLMSFSKGGDPAAPSDTATLLRLHPSHEPLRGRRPPCG